MPLHSFRRVARRMARKTKSWGTIVALTMGGNQVERKAKLQRSKSPVLLLYGFGATRRTFSILERRLHHDGFTVFSINLGGVLGTFNSRAIEELAQFIDEKIEKLYKKYQFQGKLNIISHSKGGLIGHYYVKRLGGDKRVKTLITLGTPHNGNPWALLAMFSPAPLLFKSIRQMTPMSSFIKRLKEGAFPKKVKMFSIYSKDDFVCPYPCAVLDESVNVKNIELDEISHSEFLIKKQVYQMIKLALKNETPLSLEQRTREKMKARQEAKKGLRLIEGAKSFVFNPPPLKTAGKKS